MSFILQVKMVDKASGKVAHQAEWAQGEDSRAGMNITFDIPEQSPFRKHFQKKLYYPKPQPKKASPKKAAAKTKKSAKKS